MTAKLDFDEFDNAVIMGRRSTQRPDQNHDSRAERDFEGIVRVMQSAAKRKSCPGSPMPMDPHLAKTSARQNSYLSGLLNKLGDFVTYIASMLLLVVTNQNVDNSTISVFC